MPVGLQFNYLLLKRLYIRFYWAVNVLDMIEHRVNQSEQRRAEDVKKRRLFGILFGVFTSALAD